MRFCYRGYEISAQRVARYCDIKCQAIRMSDGITVQSYSLKPNFITMTNPTVNDAIRQLKLNVDNFLDS